MANDYRDRSRQGEDRDDRERWRDDDNRGMFGYEGEGYMSGGARDLDRDIRSREREREQWEREDWNRDREYGGRADRERYRYGAMPGDYRGQGYGRETSRGDYTTGFSSGAYGTGDRYGTGGFGRGAYGGGGYMSGGYGSGYSSGYGSDEGYVGSGFEGGDYRGGSWNEAPYRGQSFPDESGPRRDYEHDWAPWRDRGRERDEHPSFRGRGPKGYQRSDDRIREDVCERLAMDDHVDASEIDVKVSSGIVSLGGHVGDRHQKRRAEDLVEDINGVKDVENNLRIGRARDEETSPAQSSERSNASSTQPAGNTSAGTQTTTSNKSRSK